MSNTLPTTGHNHVAIAPGASLALAAADFPFSDADAGDSLQKILILNPPAEGQLLLDGQAVTAQTTLPVGDLANLSYQAPAYQPSNPFGTWVQHLTFKVSDGQAWSQDSGTLDFFITPPTSTASNPVWTGDSANPLDDTHKGSAKPDLMIGYGGNDKLTGLGGNDQLFGEDGNDALYGGAGGDYLSGGAGGDTLTGSAGKDTLRGGDGGDTLYGGNGKTAKQGAGSGGDALNGGGGNDKLYGGDGSDLLIGGAGSDILDGGKGKDNYGYSTDDLVANTQDTVYATAGDRLLFTAPVWDGLHVGSSAAGGIDADHPIAFVPGSGQNPGLLEFDINQDGQFVEKDDFSVKLVGVHQLAVSGDGFVLT